MKCKWQSVLLVLAVTWLASVLLAAGSMFAVTRWCSTNRFGVMPIALKWRRWKCGLTRIATTANSPLIPMVMAMPCYC